MTRNRTLLIGAVAAIAAIAAYWFLLLAPQREQITKLDGDIAAQQAELEQSEKLLAAYGDAKDNYRVNYAKLVRLGKAVPADDDVRSLMIQIDDAADRSGVDFGKIEIGGGTGVAAAPTDPAGGAVGTVPGTVPFGTSGFSALPFSFSFTGRFFELSEFLAHLERFVSVQNEDIGVIGRLLRLESVSFQPSPQGFPDIRAEIGAASYIVPPTEDLLGGATPAGPAETPPVAAPETDTANAAPGVPTATATGGAR
jgi:Tfp pilus assembly protein PilO